MTPAEIRTAWAEAQAARGENPFHREFYFRTGISGEHVDRRFREWNITRHDTVAAICEKHGVDVREQGFALFLSLFYWPEDSESKVILQCARYLEMQHQQEGAEELYRVLSGKILRGRGPIDWIMMDPSPEGEGDPREGKDWPEEEDCPGCPSGRKGHPEGHKFGCSVVGGQVKIPVRAIPKPLG